MSWSEDLLHSLVPEQYKKDIKDYDDLTDIEKETYQHTLDIIQTSGITIDDLKKYIESMRSSVELELAKLPEGDPKNVFLKARLLNYILLEGFFGRPERAKETLKYLLKRGKV